MRHHEVEATSANFSNVAAMGSISSSTLQANGFSATSASGSAGLSIPHEATSKTIGRAQLTARTSKRRRTVIFGHPRQTLTYSFQYFRASNSQFESQFLRP